MISPNENSEGGYLIPESIIALMKKKYPDISIEERTILSPHGTSNPIKLSIICGITTRYSDDKVPVIYINEKNSKENIYFLFLSLNSSVSLSESIGALMLDSVDLNIHQIRSLIIDTGIEWIPFTVEEMLEVEFFTGTISPTSLKSSEDLFFIHDFQHINVRFQTIMKRINALYNSRFWEEVLMNIRKLLENLVHVWWQKNIDTNCSDFNTSEGVPIALNKKLDLVKQKGGINQNELRKLMSYKIIADFSVHSKDFTASKTEAIEAIAVLKQITQRLFPSE